MELTAEEFFRNKIRESYQVLQSFSLSQMDYLNAEQAMRWAHEFAQKYKEKADKWDKLESKIDAFYEYEDNEGDLCDIGEVAAMAFGYL